MEDLPKLQPLFTPLGDSQVFKDLNAPPKVQVARRASGTSWAAPKPGPSSAPKAKVKKGKAKPSPKPKSTPEAEVPVQEGMAEGTLLIDDGLHFMNFALKDVADGDLNHSEIEAVLLLWLTYGLTGEVLAAPLARSKKSELVKMTSYKIVRDYLQKRLQEAHGVEKKGGKAPAAEGGEKRGQEEEVIESSPNIDPDMASDLVRMIRTTDALKVGRVILEHNPLEHCSVKKLQQIKRLHKTFATSAASIWSKGAAHFVRGTPQETQSTIIGFCLDKIYDNFPPSWMQMLLLVYNTMPKTQVADNAELELEKDALKQLCAVNPILASVKDMFSEDGNAVEAAIMMRTLHLFALLGEASACVVEWNEASPSHVEDLDLKVKALSSDAVVFALVGKEFQMDPTQKQIYVQTWKDVFLLPMPEKPRVTDGAAAALYQGPMDEKALAVFKEKTERDLGRKTVPEINKVAMDLGVHAAMETALASKRNHFGKIAKGSLVCYLVDRMTEFATRRQPVCEQDDAARVLGMVEVLDVATVEGLQEAEPPVDPAAHSPPYVDFDGRVHHVGAVVPVHPITQQNEAFIGMRIACGVQELLRTMSLPQQAFCGCTHRVVNHRGVSTMSKTIRYTFEDMDLQMPFVGVVAATKHANSWQDERHMSMGTVTLKNGAVWNLSMTPEVQMLNPKSKCFVAAWAVPAVPRDAPADAATLRVEHVKMADTKAAF